MGKKIVILNGSPRKNGNTSMLLDFFAQGAEQAGHTVTRFDLQSMNIHPCIGCLKGGKDPGSPCTQKDDMDKIYPAYKDADVLVLASPMYYWSFTAQLKAVIDRLFAVMEAEGKAAFKETMMLVAAEDTGESNEAPMIAYYETLVSKLKWRDIGYLFAGGVFKVGDIEGKPVLEDARRLGASIK